MLEAMPVTVLESVPERIDLTAGRGATRRPEDEFDLHRIAALAAATPPSRHGAMSW
jgi:hypothetical protein